jgi:hypothetical protein
VTYTVCLKCGKEFEITTSGGRLCPSCEAKKPCVIAQGWECPKCGAVLAPIQPYCTFCAPEHPLWTWDATK